MWWIWAVPSPPHGGIQVCAKSLQLCPTLCDAVDCSPPVSSTHGILQARILEWVAMPSSRGSPRPRDQTHASCSSCTGQAGSLPPSHLECAGEVQLTPKRGSLTAHAHSRHTHHPGRKVRDGQRAGSYANAPFHLEEVLRGFPQSPSTGLASSHC